MFAFKKKYFLIIQNIKDINLNNFKRLNKFIIIYRNDDLNQDFIALRKFRIKCKSKSIKFFIANNLKLAILLSADGIYLSAYNKTFKQLNHKNFKFSIIGSAHSIKEINLKLKQGCTFIMLSKLFVVDYDRACPIIGIIKFNFFLKNISHRLIPLGGIKLNNLNFLKNVKCDGFALMSEIKKKPTISSRLF
jgi:thiamine-phosphate pyrophosphorylase|tara:strand:- start:573 stop:1145 length:573 start_codon:yes stop_codon:yes gene_type:complete